MIRIRRRIAREEIDHLIQEDPFYQGEMADDEIIDCRALKFSPVLAFLEKDYPEILRATEKRR
jgi:hypothetical protein